MKPKSRIRGPLAVLLCFALAAVLVWLDATRPTADRATAPGTAVGDLGGAEDPEPRDVANTGVEVAGARMPAPSRELAPEEVLGNPDCGIAAGWGMPAGDVALVVVPGGLDGEPSVGGRFAVLDDRGTLFSGELPFRPNHWRLGRRPDGGVVTAFGDLRLNSMTPRPPESREPLRVYLDGGLVYESDKAWNFGVARDGSSFFAIEPLAGEASRLVIHNLDLGVETHHDLGGELNALSESYRPYGASYSGDAGEVRFWPPQQLNGSPRGDYWFYPVAGGPPRVVRVETARHSWRPPDAAADALDPRSVYVERLEGRSGDRIVFESSEVAYLLADRSEDHPWRGPFLVARHDYGGYGSEDGPRRTEVWRRLVPMHVSTWAGPEGPWLALRGPSERVLVLDKSTGEHVLAFPAIEDYRLRIPEHMWSQKVPDLDADMNHLQWAMASAALTRLRGGVLGPEATVGEVGRLTGMSFEDGNRLVLTRSIGRYPNLRKVQDVFDMETVELDSGPAFRLEKDDLRCGRGGLRGLDVRDGQLVYPGPRATPTSDGGWPVPNSTGEEDKP